MVVEKTPRGTAFFVMTTSTLIQDFVTVRPGEPFRLFPFGTIYKGGRKREITPEYAKGINLPHFRAPIKLGSHDETTPAGGFITALEVREDGIYAVPEWNEKGLQALIDGAYRYNSPEILWAGGLENPSDGSAINAPLILGTALLHTPHLGEATAMYEVEVIETDKENNMEENITFPKSLWDRFVAPLLDRKTETVEVVKTIEPEDYAIAKQERDELKARIEAQEAARLQGERVEKYTAELKETKADAALAELLAELTDEKAELIVTQFKALTAQIDESALLGEKGTEGGTEQDPKAAFNAAVLSIMQEKKITNYNAAFEVAKTELADLFKAAFAK